MEKYIVNNKSYSIEKLLGKGKGGYSYLAFDEEGNKVTLKKIHHEPCSYYQFGNKIEAELNDYKRLSATGIRIPKMIDIDMEQEIIIKEYVDGPTIVEVILQEKMKETYLDQVKDMARVLQEKGLNIDYYPTNFIVMNDLIYYIDFECNQYSYEWSFENWGYKYWSKTEDFVKSFILR